jgi:hypothetical protein
MHIGYWWESQRESRWLTLVPRSRIFLPWRWRRNVPPKRRFTQDLHGTTSQKAAFFIVTAVKTSNPTCQFMFVWFEPLFIRYAIYLIRQGACLIMVMDSFRL